MGVCVQRKRFDSEVFGKMIRVRMFHVGMTVHLSFSRQDLAILVALRCFGVA